MSDQGTKIMIVTPTASSVAARTLISYVDLVTALKGRGLDFEVNTYIDSLLTRARNAIAYRFLRSDCSHLMLIDSDIQFRPSDFFRLLEHDRPLACATYRKKTNAEILYAHRVDPLLAPTGFMLLRRDCMELMARHHPPYSGGYPFFETMIEGGIHYSEDYAFCRRYIALGGEIFIDFDINLNHVGECVYEGNPREHGCG